MTEPGDVHPAGLAGLSRPRPSRAARNLIRLGVLTALVAAGAGPRRAEAQIASDCRPSCHEKRYKLAVDVDGNGLPDPGDTIEYAVTLCADPPGFPLRIVCNATDLVDELNAAGDLTLVEDPAAPGSGILARCTADDPGLSPCPAPAGGVTDCTASVIGDEVSVHVEIDYLVGGCVTYRFWAAIAAAPGAGRVCNQAHTLAQFSPATVSDDPTTGAAGDATCFDLAPFQATLLRALGGSDRTPPWVFTARCPSGDDHLAVPFLSAVASGTDVEPSSGAAGELALYQMDCATSSPMSLTIDRAVSPPAVQLVY